MFKLSLSIVFLSIGICSSTSKQLKTQRQRQRTNKMIALTVWKGMILKWRVLKTEPKLSQMNLRRSPSSQDKLVTCLMRADTLKDVLIHAFAIATACNWAYLQFHLLSPPLKIFLAASMAIIKAQGKPIFEEIPVKEQAAILNIQGSQMIDVHDWIIIMKACHDWGLDVLVIPHLFSAEGCGHKKRAQMIHELLVLGHAPQHFGMSQQIHSVMKPSPNSKPESTEGFWYWNAHMMSVHPTILEAEHWVPCPAEWHFQMGEPVVMSGGPQRDCIGTISQIHEHGLEISLNDESGTHHCPFLWAEKVFATGDYIHCMDNDREGFVQTVDVFQLSIFQQHEDGHLDECSCTKNSVIKVLAPARDMALHDNHWLGTWVTVTDPASPLCGQEGIIKCVVKNSSGGLAATVIGHEEDLFLPLTEHPYSSETHLNFEHYSLQASQSHSDNMPPLHSTLRKMPWIRVEVVIGTVRDVICGQSTESGLSVIIILNNFDPVTTNKDLDANGNLLVGQAVTKQPLIQERAGTPPPTDAVWDPYSKNPPPPPFTSGTSLPLSPSRNYEHQGHWMTDPSLVDHELHVHVGVKVKVIVLQQRSDGCGVQAYICKGKKKLEPVEPGMVQAMHPATPHNYERWIVIKGKHTGKYVHLIRYDKWAPATPAKIHALSNLNQGPKYVRQLLPLDDVVPSLRFNLSCYVSTAFNALL
ncbi:hypothetical protein EV421DRAFT_1739264 [Armillaria borealis]|uniref:KOW domain-containing protein n=1 Tax=Armillaria borealis TaxID=47425 RepID=A0AA39J7G4_9AGAR|nr:hypothetical protein EV421DRAFT_1739264 [Armillaria borealis]